MKEPKIVNFVKISDLGTWTRVREAVELTRAAASLSGHPELSALLLLSGVNLLYPRSPEQHSPLLAVHWQQDAGEVPLLPHLVSVTHDGLGSSDHRALAHHHRLPTLTPSLGRVLVQVHHLAAVVGLLHAQAVTALQSFNQTSTFQDGVYVFFTNPTRVWLKNRCQVLQQCYAF